MTTEEEMDDIIKCIVLPLLIDLVDKWEYFPLATPLKHLHESQFQDLRDMITIDHVEVKQRLRATNVKMVKKEKFSPSLDYTIYVRGGVENVGFMKGHIKSIMSQSLGKYVARLDWSKFKNY
ncbi:hypothetical protein [Paenibacillus oryzisoli]|uniref:Uncharacterized protein n=1 Tax=Paenibacillus oryzisoli TaxID=1850517 RepID=A0A198AHZ2_9BACL|nr:hypothetical protein [Paenibacillus oryzisoli]OAS21124.1 hypothetical protein A8708_29995 [Paenibacillus oryzisoli]